MKNNRFKINPTKINHTAILFALMGFGVQVPAVACDVTYLNPLSADSYQVVEGVINTVIGNSDYQNQKAWYDLRTEVNDAEIQSEAFVNSNGTLIQMACAGWNVVKVLKTLEPEIKAKLTNETLKCEAKAMLRFKQNVINKLGAKPANCEQ
jgi:hypothetical protein